jgi:hypothetical protein
MYGINAQSNCTECHSSNVPSPPVAQSLLFTKALCKKLQSAFFVVARNGLSLR